MHFAREPGDPIGLCDRKMDRACRAVERPEPTMNADGKSDRPKVPTKSPNKAEGTAAEAMEGRVRTKGNLLEGNTLRPQGGDGGHSALERVRQVAKEDRKQRFTALLHHVYDIERLRRAFLAIKRDAVAGVGCRSWREQRRN